LLPMLLNMDPSSARWTYAPAPMVAAPHREKRNEPRIILAHEKDRSAPCVPWDMSHRLIGAVAFFVIATCMPGCPVRAQASAAAPPQPPVLTAFSINGGADTVSAAAPTVTLVHTVVGTAPTGVPLSAVARTLSGRPGFPMRRHRPFGDWYDATGEPCGPQRESHRVTLYLQVRATVGEEMRIIDGQRQLVPARVESNVLRATICARLAGGIVSATEPGSVAPLTLAHVRCKSVTCCTR
jgi:hypothetical protein